MNDLNRGIGPLFRRLNQPVRFQDGGLVMRQNEQTGRYQVVDSSGRVQYNSPSEASAKNYLRKRQPATTAEQVEETRASLAERAEKREAERAAQAAAAAERAADPEAQQRLADYRERIQERARAAAEKGQQGTPLNRLFGSVKELMDATGLGFNEAGALLGTGSGLERTGVGTTGNPYRVEGPNMVLSDAFSELADPTDLLRAANRGLIDFDSQYEQAETYPREGQVVGGSGPVTLVESTIAGRKVLTPHLTGPSGQRLTQITQSGGSLGSDLSRLGLNLSQEDIDAIRGQTRDWYVSQGLDPELAAARSEVFLEEATPTARDLPDLADFVTVRATPQGALPAVGSLSSTPAGNLTASETLMSPLTDYLAQNPFQGSTSYEQPATQQPATQQPAPVTVDPYMTSPLLSGVTTDPYMARTLGEYYANMYSSPYFNYYGTPYMFESVFDSGVYNPGGSNQ